MRGSDGAVAADGRDDNGGAGLRGRAGELDSGGGLDNLDGGADSNGGGSSSGAGGGSRALGSGGRVGAESGSGGQNLVEGNVATTVLEDLRGGGGADVVEAAADASKVLKGAVGLGLDSSLESGESALGDVGKSLGTRDGGEGNGSESVLHFEGWKRLAGLKDWRLVPKIC